MQPIGKYGRMRKRYLKEHRPVLYSQLNVSGKLFSHLREIDSTCNTMLERNTDLRYDKFADKTASTGEFRPLSNPIII